MQKRRWTYAEAQMVGCREARLGVCTVTGIITPHTSALVLADNHRWMRQAAIHGQVADYRGAAMCVDEHELMRSAIGAMRDNDEILRPTALVVTAEHLPLFHRYAWLAAQHGVCRAAFTETGPALEWVRRQAEVFEQWPAMRLAASAGCSSTDAASVPAQEPFGPA